MLGGQTLTYKEAKYLTIGVEDGWIHVDSATWKQYLVAKDYIKNIEKGLISLYDIKWY